MNLSAFLTWGRSRDTSTRFNTRCKFCDMPTIGAPQIAVESTGAHRQSGDEASRKDAWPRSTARIRFLSIVPVATSSFTRHESQRLFEC